jgi:hypothetical protein
MWLAALRTFAREQHHRRALERAANVACVGAELIDDLAVEIVLGR